MKNIQQIDLLKDFITGIFDKNHELSEIDDDVFIAVIKGGIDRPSIKGAPQIYNEILEHAISEFIKSCLQAAIKNGETDLEREKKEARRDFLRHYKEA